MTDTLVEKVRKLLALADSPNENEAALAAEKAQELMLRHGISMAQVAQASGKDKVLSVDEAQSRGKTTPWRTHLASYVARSMGGKIVYSNDYGRQEGTIYWFGPAGTLESMIDLYRYLENTLVSLSAVETANRPVDPWTGKRVHGKTYRSSWLKGATHRIGSRLMKRVKVAANESGDTSTALVVIRNAVDEKMSERFPHTRKRQESGTVNYDAYRKGSATAAGVALGDRQVGAGRGALPAGR
jgi:hypothetical protein